MSDYDYSDPLKHRHLREDFKGVCEDAKRLELELTRLREENARQAAEIERLRAALKPFTGEKCPSRNRTKIGFDRNGLRRIISPLELAMLDAYRASLPDLPAPDPRCRTCQGERNCYCARAALTQEPANEGR